MYVIDVPNRLLPQMEKAIRAWTRFISTNESVRFTVADFNVFKTEKGECWKFHPITTQRCLVFETLSSSLHFSGSAILSS